MTESVLDVLGSARSMRWFTEDPVDPKLIEQLVWAATRASNANNTQPWDFVVVTSSEVKREVKEAITGIRSAATSNEEAAAYQLPADPVSRRTVQGAMNLAANLERVPALIFICGANRYPEDQPVLEWAYSAVFAAGQNLLVAARALGLGAAFTTLHRQAESAIREILAIPSDRLIGLTMPVGWPARPFGPVTRRPVSEVIHFDRW